MALSVRLLVAVKNRGGGGCLPRGSVNVSTDYTGAPRINPFRISLGVPIPVEQLFDPPQRFVEGQRIQIQEILDLFFTIEDAALVDVDLSWYGSKQFIGNWRLNVNTDAPTSVTEGDEGSITSQFFTIVRYSEYTVVPPRGRTGGTLGGTGIDNCNFALIDGIAVFPPDPLPKAVTLPIQDRQLFTGDISIDYPLLGVEEFFPKITSIGIGLAEGVNIARATYRVSVINEVQLRRDPVRDRVSCVFGDADCFLEAQTLGGLPYPELLRRTQGEAFADCIAAGGDAPGGPACSEFVVPFPWACSDGSNYIYWGYNASGG